MISADILEYGQPAHDFLGFNQGDIAAVFSKTIYLRSGESLCCLGLESLVNGPINIRTSLPRLSGLSIGERWRYQNKTLVLGQYYHCHGNNASVWTIPDKPALPHSPIYEDCIKQVETVLRGYSSITNVQTGITNTLAQHQLRDYLSLFEHSLLSAGKSENYVIPSKLIGLLGCGDGLTPAGDDILLGVLMAAIHFDVPYLAEPLKKWIRRHATDRTSQISLAHLISATEGQAIEYLHRTLNSINSHLIKSENGCRSDQSSNHALQRSMTDLISHGHSSGYYTLSGVLLVLKHLSYSATKYG